MRIQILSDLHIDHDTNYNVCKNLSPIENDKSILIIAGDTCSFNYRKKHKFFENIFSKWNIVIEIPGNHDNYVLSHDWELANSSNVVTQNNGSTHYYLNNSFIDIDNVRFICSTMWSYVRPQYEMDILRGMTDYYLIKDYNIKINNDRFFKSKDFILKTIQNTPDNMSCIIITHHLPLLQLISKKYIGNVLNDAYASDCSGIIELYTNKINYWIHGHSHDFLNVKYLNTRFIRNPVGYLKYGEGKDFDRNYVIEI